MAEWFSGNEAATYKRSALISLLHKASVHCRLPRTLVAALVSGALGGCAALTGPERLEIPGNTPEFKSRLYAGAAIGNSYLKPDTRGTVFTVDSSDDTGTQLRLGYDVHNLLAVELDTSVLGTSQLREANTDVKYSSASVSALIYAMSGVQMRSRREGLSAYGRVGMAALKKSSSVLPLEESATVPVLGIGAEYGFTNGLGMRAELTRFDSDAVYAGFGAIYRFGIAPAGIGRMIAKAADPALNSGERGRSSEKETVVEYYAGPNARSTANRGKDPNYRYTAGAESTGKFTAGMSDRWRPAMRADDKDSDGVLDNADRCPGTQRYITVDRYGCGLFDAVLEDVTFKSGSDWLTPRARGQLDRLAYTLLAFPESRIQVRAHTDSVGSSEVNLALSSRRAEVVVLYLQSKGVHELQLQFLGMGEVQPIDTNQTPEGRRKNRRVDIVTLPDRDTDKPFGSATMESLRVSHTPIGPDSIRALAQNGKDWNTAGKPSRRAPTQSVVPSKTDQGPSLMAAMPATKSTAPRVSPFPKPGSAPGFALTGIIKGVSFDDGQSALSANGEQALKPLIQAMHDSQHVRIAVMAHTDNRGSAEDNEVLSNQRAQTVVNYLAQNGIDPARMKAEGYGEMLPLVQNLTDSDRARNRRIEVRILPDSQ